MDRLPSGSIAHLARENEDYENEDGIEAERLQAKHELENYLTELRNSVEDPAMDTKTKAEDKAILYTQIVDVMGWIGSSQLASPETYAKKRQELEEVATPIMGKK